MPVRTVDAASGQNQIPVGVGQQSSRRYTMRTGGFAVPITVLAGFCGVPREARVLPHRMFFSTVRLEVVVVSKDGVDRDAFGTRRLAGVARVTTVKPTQKRTVILEHPTFRP